MKPLFIEQRLFRFTHIIKQYYYDSSVLLSFSSQVLIIDLSNSRQVVIC